MYVLALSDYKQLAAAAGYKPAPQLGRQFAVYQAITSQYFVFFYLFFIRLALSLYYLCT